MDWSYYLILAVIIFIIAVVMTMTGRGGGNFYVTALALAGLSMNDSATIGQFILTITALSSIFILNKHKMVDWRMTLIMLIPTALMAYIGGLLANDIADKTLKYCFSGLLTVAGLMMLVKVKEKAVIKEKRLGYVYRNYGGFEYNLNLWVSLPSTLVIGFIAGALGISGGSFIVPLLVLVCRVPMKIAVGTSSTMVAFTAFSGLLGHLTPYLRGTATADFDYILCIILGVVAVVGGIIGANFATKTKSKKLKVVFAITTLVAAGVMVIKSYI